jgi:branched-chain amino acid transport system permease protein
MEIFIQQLVNSLSVASVTILIGIGITLIFGLAGIVNFAHGEFLMIGGMITWFLVTSGMNFFVALVVIRVFNEVQKTIPDPLGKVWVVGGVNVIAMRAVVVVLTAVVVTITYFGISRSRYGIALRASIADQETAALMGIPVRRYVTGVFVYGSVLAGLGGALMIALFPITPFTGSVLIIRGFAVSLIGGLGNVAGAVAGGLILGLVDGLSAGYGFPEWTDAYSLVVMIAILIVRPQGLLGGTLGPRAT